jgi:hypothetical protein
MPSWLLPAVKLILPHVADLVSAAKPVFTKRRSAEVEDPAALVQQQIAELQVAATENATNLKALAEQLRLTVAALEQAAAAADRRMKRAYALSVGAGALSLIAFGTALYALFSA